MTTSARPFTWHTSSYSGNTGNCVEVGNAVNAVGVRDTKNRDGGTLVFTGDQWESFLTTVKRSH
ncbi:DUF397 domain-containing protein [Actinopolyspora sp. H202]|uniref:DUF397 domain-containing protein n=1 Tax=Actinopolyspora sp. H202 TaxID=1500456 RepID=UPI003EE74DA1